jgi:pimeloyl-ACP methyl ester carboxylesterase
MGWKKFAAVGVGALVVAGAGAGVVSVLGRRARRSHDEIRDAEMAPPDGVAHHFLETSDGGSLHVAVTGQGPPVVLMHGVTLQWWVWSAVIQRLRNDHQVFAWDMRGHGESVAGTRGVSLEACADDLQLLIEHFDLHEVVAVGHSMGGMALGRYSVDHHATLELRFAGLIFLATSVAPVSFDLIRGGMSGALKPIARFAKTGTRRPKLQYPWPDSNIVALMVSRAFGPSATGPMIDDVRQMLAAVPQRTLAEALTSLTEHDVRDELSHVSIPTTVVVGDSDRLTPPAHAKGVRRAIPGAELVVLDEVGHQVMQEDPDAVVAAIASLRDR